MNSFQSELYKSLKQTNSYAVGAIGTALTGIAFYFDTGSTVSLKWLSVPLLISFIIFIVLMNLSMRLYENTKEKLPIVLSSQKITVRDIEGILLLLQPSILFSTNVIVSVYHVNSEDWEILIGVGRVHHVQEDGKIQVFVHVKTQNSEEKWLEIERRDAAVLKGIRVKPSAPYEFFAEGIA